ncbi:MAG: dihydroorotate dehydrogenase electron transfer subunit [Candidatus Symbiothrix sp.]|jgi:dihydroorotate dehydrogenase electron transfer subunit|nr:dihydroorotate dehydrogenase electron transfer subunit [Candidatus Symbiothrix sp.]
MKKYIDDWVVRENRKLTDHAFLLKLQLNRELPEIHAGQFVQILVENAENVFLRRPISIHSVDPETRTMDLLAQIVGKGTCKLANLHVNSSVNLIYPLGNGFTIPINNKQQKLLLIGGGVGIAPLLFLGQTLKKQGFTPIFLLGARSAKDVLLLTEFQQTGEAYITTEDGSLGEKGFVTNHSLLASGDFDFIYTCGPQAMMLAVAHYAKQHQISCEASLENRMACGIGACLCCVEKTIQGNLCVCTEGPVFNINDLSWQI